ncbi:MAG: methyl viologen-reducing hydrogenase [Candidatus Electrothrix sp. MAN1_4]|nr:methyl viologen-reducing hydrogenase [Candidatus Electrothrix sp. MAN1_4]
MEADFGIITGSIRTEHDKEAAHKMRASCGTIVALGVCSAHGGPHGGNTFHRAEDMLHNAFCDHPTTLRGATVPDQNLPAFLAHNRPLDTEINVDAYIPGCPPHPKIIKEGIEALIRPDFQPIFSQHNICYECKRRMDRMPEVNSLRRDFEGQPDPDLCFLSQGYLCFGSVTLDRCLAPCPKAGVPCFACSGPSVHVLLEPQKDVRTMIAELIAQLTSISVQEAAQELKEHFNAHALFLNSSPMMRAKPTRYIDPVIPQRWEGVSV